MERIELNAYEKKDLIEYLKYAKEQKELNKPPINIIARQTRRFDTTDYDINRINNLLSILTTNKDRISLKKKI